MKKSAAIVAGLVVLAGAWLGGTWYTGQMLETKSAQGIAQFNAQIAEQTPPGMRVTLAELSLERGFFSSRARYAVNVVTDRPVSRQLKEPLDVQLEMDVEYEHGPFPASALARGQFMPQMVFARSNLRETESTAQWFKLAQGQTPLTVQATATYGGNGQFALNFAALKTEHKNAAFSFAGAKMDGTVQGKSQHKIQNVQAVLSMPEISMTSVEGRTKAPFALHLNDLRMDVDTWQNRFDTRSGSNQLSIANLRMEEDGQTKLTLEQLTYNTTHTDDEQFMHAEATLSAKAVAVAGQALGNLSITTQLKRLDGKTVKQLAGTLSEVFAQARKNQSPQEVNLTLTSAVDDLIEIAQSLLAHSPALMQELNLETDKGRSTLALNLTLQPLPATTPMDLSTLYRAVKSATLDVNAHQPMLTDLSAKLLQITGAKTNAQTEAVKQIEQGVLMATLLGIVEKQGDALKSRWAYDGTRFSVNGREMPLEGLFQLIR